MESSQGETRVAATPETVKKFRALGCKVCIETGAGFAAGFLDDDYVSAGAEIVDQGQSLAWGQAEVLLCVQSPPKRLLELLPSRALVVGLLAPFGNGDLMSALQDGSLSAISL